MNTHASGLPLTDVGFYSEVDACAATEAGIQCLLARLPKADHWCVEFGAWDGLVGSTTRNLIQKHRYSAVLIEGDRNKFQELQKNYAGQPGIHTINQFVGFQAGAPDHLDEILSTTNIPLDFDFLVIDIDGNDYHVWESLAKYRPKIVMIEFNPTIPPEVHFVQPADPAVNQGCSLTALVELARKKKYQLISVLGVNAFFATSELFPVFEIPDNRVETLWTRRDCVTYLFSGYDGHLFLRGSCKLPWHDGMVIPEHRVQALPAFAQKYPYTRKRRLFYTCVTNPAEIARKLLRRWLK